MLDLYAGEEWWVLEGVSLSISLSLSPSLREVRVSRMFLSSGEKDITPRFRR